MIIETPCYFARMESPHDESGRDGKALGPIDNSAVRLFLENRQAFKTFLRRQLPSEMEAEDVLQHSLLKAIRNPDAFHEKENVAAWFYRILRNSLTDHYRSRAAEGRKHDGLLREMIALGGDSQAAPDAGLMNGICACLERQLPALKPEYAEILKRVDLDGESPAAVAETGGITYNNLMVRLHRARQALRKSLELSCGACTKHGCLECSCGK